MINSKHYVWVEKYRPDKIDNCILPKDIKDQIKSKIGEGEIPHFLFYGTQGLGKTTAARAICAELDADYIIINGSKDGNIDTLRTTIQNFASTGSLSGKKKIIILDEGDYVNANSTQPALRNFMEEFSENCRFIITCNYINKILPAIQSRCAVINFSFPKNQKKVFYTELAKRLKTILKAEEVEFDIKAIGLLISKYFPDIRRIINDLQRCSIIQEDGTKKLEIGSLVEDESAEIVELYKLLREKKFKLIRTWVTENSYRVSDFLFTKMFKFADDYLENQSIPSLVVLMSEYQYKKSFSVDEEITILAFLIEVMNECKFK